MEHDNAEIIVELPSAEARRVYAEILHAEPGQSPGYNYNDLLQIIGSDSRGRYSLLTPQTPDDERLLAAVEAIRRAVEVEHGMITPRLQYGPDSTLTREDIPALIEKNAAIVADMMNEEYRGAIVRVIRKIVDHAGRAAQSATSTGWSRPSLQRPLLDKQRSQISMGKRNRLVFNVPVPHPHVLPDAKRLQDSVTQALGKRPPVSASATTVFLDCTGVYEEAAARQIESATVTDLLLEVKKQNPAARIVLMGVSPRQISKLSTTHLDRIFSHISEYPNIEAVELEMREKESGRKRG